MSNYIQWLKNAAVSRQVRRLVVCAVLALPGVTILSGTCRVAIADDDGIPDLAHPLIAESPTPDTELRFEYIVINSDSADELEINPEGELATVRAAGKAGTLMIMSISSTKMMEEVAAEASGPIWFQQYLYRDRNLTAQFAHRAEEAGFKAICVTVDTRAGTKRERNLRNDYIKIDKE